MKRSMIFILLIVIVLSGVAYGASDEDYIKVGLIQKKETYSSFSLVFEGAHFIKTSVGASETLMSMDAGASYTVKLDTGVIGLYQNELHIIDLKSDESVLLPVIDGDLSINGVRYRGGVSVHLNSDKTLTIINQVKRSSYLFGVLPKEMSPNWPLEALKAQAVAARTYVETQQGRHGGNGYDVCDTVHCQVYGGYSVEGNLSNEAVMATKDQIITYNNKPITAFYHSNSGGYTENSENVYMSALPYIKAVYDPYSIGQPNDFWVASFTESEIASVLSKSGLNVGKITGITSRGTATSGRTTLLEIAGTTDTVLLEKEKARQIFGYTTIKSMLFNVSKGDKITVLSSEGMHSKSLDGMVVMAASLERKTINEKASVYNGSTFETIATGGKDYSFIGKGYGHGLGMSQWGAKAMAENGLLYEDILHHYYTDVVIFK